MKKLITSLILVSFLILSLPSSKANYIAPQAPPTRDVKSMIQEISPRFNQSPTLISKIMWCESNHKVALHDNGAGKGVTGIHKNTFRGWLPLYEKEWSETLRYDSSYDQIKMMSWAFSKGNSYRNQWTSYVAYTNGGTYAFYSKLLKKDFVVKCS